MKKLLLIIIILSTAFTGKGQNLVPNGDFEQYSTCPNDFSQIDFAIPWMNPSNNFGTPDYYNQCANGGTIDVPNNFWGYQPAMSGNAYSGIFIWVSWDQIREYIEAPLATTLIAGNCYHFEMYVNLPDECQYTSDAIGIYFTDTVFTGINNFDPLPVTPQIINTTGIITDTLNWVLISGNYTASGGENYLIIGNYKDNLTTNPVIINNFGSWTGAYLFIDDVSLTPCTAIEEQNQNSSITIYPNPANEYVTINYQFKAGDEIQLTDALGKLLFTTKIKTPSSDFLLPTSDLSPGIYFLKAGNEVRKFVKE